jgi:hypothetical protein
MVGYVVGFGVGFGVVALVAGCGHAALDRKASMKTATAMLLTLTGFIDFSWFVWIRIGPPFFFFRPGKIG